MCLAFSFTSKKHWTINREKMQYHSLKIEIYLNSNKKEALQLIDSLLF